RDPRGVTGLARHATIGVRQVGRLALPADRVAPGAAVAPQRLREARPPRLVSVLDGPGGAGVDRVGDLGDRPFEAPGHHRALDERVAAPLEAELPERRPQRREVSAPGGRRRTRCLERAASLDGAVAVGARDLDRRAHFAIELSVAVGVLLEVTV